MTGPYHNTHRLSAEVEKSGHAAYVTLDGVLARTGVLTIHLPYPPGRYLMRARLLSKMRPLAAFIRTARAGVVGDVALVVPPTRGAIATGPDAFENESVPNPEFWSLKNIVLTRPIASGPAATRPPTARSGTPPPRLKF